MSKEKLRVIVVIAIVLVVALALHMSITQQTNLTKDLLEATEDSNRKLYDLELLQHETNDRQLINRTALDSLNSQLVGIEDLFITNDADVTTMRSEIENAYREKILEALAFEIRQVLVSKKYEQLIPYIHPHCELEISLQEHMLVLESITPDMLENIDDIEETYLWGYLDGSGKEVIQTPKEMLDKYFASFNYERDDIYVDISCHKPWHIGVVSLRKIQESSADTNLERINFYFNNTNGLPKLTGLSLFDAWQ